jgi:hypothetical protein
MDGRVERMLPHLLADYQVAICIRQWQCNGTQLPEYQ